VLLIGIDEAGYGPPLGPLCHGLAVFRVPGAAGAEAPDLWRRLAPAVARCPAPPGAIAVDDSKQLYTGPRDLARLRRSVQCFLSCLQPPGCPDAGAMLPRLLPGADVARIERDPWGRQTGAPGEQHAQDAAAAEGLRRRLASADVALVACEARALSARDFNARLKECGGKAEVAWERVAELLRRAAAWAGQGEPWRAVVDRQGGRKFYAARLGQAFNGGWVWAREETDRRSAYDLEFRGSAARVEFLEGADRLVFPVALASLAAKLARELLMDRFNAFFRSQQPGLQPTAGYPQDAHRFLRETRSLRERLRISDAHLIRQK
jgi:hypothetical protein